MNDGLGPRQRKNGVRRYSSANKPGAHPRPATMIPVQSVGKHKRWRYCPGCGHTHQKCVCG